MVLLSLFTGTILNIYKMRGKVDFFRRARGYVPDPFTTDNNVTGINNHPSIVSKTGNQVIHQWMNKYLTRCDEAWRGIVIIPIRGLNLLFLFLHPVLEFNIIPIFQEIFFFYPCSIACLINTFHSSSNSDS